MSLVLSKREYLGDVVTASSLSGGSTVFNSQSFIVNPGLVDVFPWGADIANQFNQYQMAAFEVQFVSTSATALGSTNTALGTVMMTFNANVTEPAYATKQAVLASGNAFSTTPSKSVALSLPGSVMGKRLFIRSSAVPSGQDPHAFDLGRIQICTQGMQATDVVIGQLWIQYRCVLQRPQLNGGLLTKSTISAHARDNAGTGNIDFATGSYFYTPVVDPNSTIIPAFTASTMSFPEYVRGGRYLVMYIVYAASTIACDLPTVTVANGTMPPTTQQNGTGFARWVASSGTADTSASAFMAFFVEPNGEGQCVVTFSGGSFTGGYGDCYVTEACSTIPETGTSGV